MYVVLLVAAGTTRFLVGEIRRLRRGARPHVDTLRYAFALGCLPFTASFIGAMLGFILGYCRPATEIELMAAYAAGVSESLNCVVLGGLLSVFLTLPLALYVIGRSNDGYGPLTRIE